MAYNETLTKGFKMKSTNPEQQKLDEIVQRMLAITDPTPEERAALLEEHRLARIEWWNANIAGTVIELTDGGHKTIDRIEP
jgi:hypothetical protein